MILETFVWINLSGSNISYYENLGYEIPRTLNKKGKLTIQKDNKLMVKINDLPPRSDVKITKICDYCGLEVGNQRYKDIIMNRSKTNGRDCCNDCKHIKRIDTYNLQLIPTGESLAERFPEIATEWSISLNGCSPSSVRAYSHMMAWWTCLNDTTHIYEAAINNRTNVGSNCPYCSGYKANESNCLFTTFPEIANEWHPTLNGELTPKDVVAGSNALFWWQCSINSKHSWKTSVNNRTGFNSTGCPKCANENHRGANNNKWKGGVTALNQYLRSQTFDWVAECLKQSNYKCYISGVNYGLEVHHIKPFHEIRDEIIKELDFPIYQTIGEYTQDQLNNFSDAIKERHGADDGIVLNKFIHDLFHSIYGLGLNKKIGIEDIDEFKVDYLLGKYSAIINISL